MATAKERTSGFLQQLGIGNTQGRAQPDQNAQTFAGTGFAGQALSGLFGGIKGLIDGEGGRSFKEFGRDFQRARVDFQDQNLAKDQGITVEKLRNRRALSKELAGISVGSGSLQEQIDAAGEIAQKASAVGDIEVAFKAAQMKAQLQSQLQQQKAAGMEADVDKAAFEESQGEKNIGREFKQVGEESTVTGTRIDSENFDRLGMSQEDIGKFVVFNKKGEKSVVDGSVLSDTETKFGVGTIDPKDDNIIDLAAKNGFGQGQIDKTRQNLISMGKQASIVTDIVDLLGNLVDPAFAFDFTGKTAIGATRITTFVGNAADILTTADGGRTDNQAPLEWNGRKVSEGQLRSEFKARGKDQEFLLETLNSLASADGLPKGTSLTDFMPKSLLDKFQTKNSSAKQIARVAEQYWANVMELAYMDARLQEPSNRGLSDKDIVNALKRIGAATANPASFADRQLTLLNRVSDAVSSLGAVINVPRGSSTRRQDVVDFVYSPTVRRKVDDNISQARDKLTGLRDSVDSRDAGIPSAVEALAGKADDEITAADLAGLSIEELQDLQKARSKGQ